MQSVPFRLNADQQAALEAVQRGENIFLTGPAGSGKSTLLSAIVAWANSRGKVCDVTAMTGCAALLLGARAKTLHSWAGIGLGRGTAEQLATDILKSPFAKRRWKRAHILIVDEISMMSPDLFEKLSQVGKRVRGGTAPWGGLQLILCGDFYQLPPVSKEVSQLGKFAFDAPAWTATNLQPVVLQRIERQTDATFQTLLNEARIGRLSPASIGILKARQGLNWKEQTIRPTLLFSRNTDVDAINEANLTALKKPIHTFDAETLLETDDPSLEIPKGELLERLVQRMDTDSSYVPHLELCEGCQVMLVYNMDLEKGLVNGSRGVVIGFRPADGVPIVQFLHGDPIAVVANEWVSNDYPALKRCQIPLRVAYAVTIHKSQGATLDCALIDIGSSTFECGQAYVALSRVRDLDSLYVWNFNPAKVMADPKVVEFYASLETTPAPIVAPETPTSEPEEEQELPTDPRAPPSTPVPEFETQPEPESTLVQVPEPAPALPTDIPSPMKLGKAQCLPHDIVVRKGIIADLNEVQRVEVPKEQKKPSKPRAPRKKKEDGGAVLEMKTVAAVEGIPEVPTQSKKPKAPRKKKEDQGAMLEMKDTKAVDAVEGIPEAPTQTTKDPKKPKASRKKKEDQGAMLEMKDTKGMEGVPEVPTQTTKEPKKPKAPRKKKEDGGAVLETKAPQDS